MKTTKIDPHKSSLGMDANIASLIIFIGMAVVSWVPFLGWLSWAVPLVFFYAEKNSKFVKFQAITAFVIGIIWAAVGVLLQIFIWVLMPRGLYGALNFYYGGGWGVWVLLGSLSTVISVIMTVIIVYLIIKAYGYNQVELPVIGAIAKKASEKLESMVGGQPGGGPDDTNNKE